MNLNKNINNLVFRGVFLHSDDDLDTFLRTHAGYNLYMLLKK